MSTLLSKGDILKLVNEYIGVYNGYLGDFSYRTHAEFYPLHCDLDIDPNTLEGTTRERFIKILSEQEPLKQSKIIRGILSKFPVDQIGKPASRTLELFRYFDTLASKLEHSSVVIHNPSIIEKYQVLNQALSDAEILMKQSTPTSAVDRIYTYFQGYLEAICIDQNIKIDQDESITKLFKVLKSNHPALLTSTPRNEEINKVLNSLSAIIDALPAIRNKATLSHPNPRLLDIPEAILVIDAIKTIANYLDNKLYKVS
jgi:hypothetical protein